MPAADRPRPTDGGARERAELTLIEPALERDAVDSTGRVGAVAYPYSVFDVAVTVERKFLSAREVDFVVSVDRSRRLAVRADTFPETMTRPVDDVLVIPSELSAEQAHEKAEDAAFKWTLRKFSLGTKPELELVDVVHAYKLFWLAERPDGDVLVDSVTGDESPLDD